MNVPAPLDSNTARFAARSVSSGGTSLATWQVAENLPPLDMSGCRNLVVVGAHPDDETLGFGAAAATLAASGVPVQVVSVTDGGGSHPGLDESGRNRLEQLRRAELQDALGILGLRPARSLGLPDGDVARHEAHLTELLCEILTAQPPGTWCAATWRGDGHPDHEAVGRAAAAAVAATRARLVEFPVWMWHWASPGDASVRWRRARAVPTTADARSRKSAAAQRFSSQLTPTGPGREPVLPPAVLRRLLAVGEMVFA